MNSSCFRLAFFILISVSWGLAQQPSGLVGTWVGKVERFGIDMKFVLNPDGTADLNGIAGSWQVRRNKLLVTEEGDTMTYDFRLEGSQLTLSGGDLIAPLVLSRSGNVGSMAERAATSGDHSPAAGSSPAMTPSPRGLSSSRPASRYNHEKWGLDFTVPETWKVSDRGSALLLASTTEAGLIIVRLERKTSLQTLAQGYQEGIEEEGIRLAPAGQLANFTPNGMQGLAGELAGMSNDGKRIRGRAVAVQTPYGDAVVVLGLTTEEQYSQLKPRVDTLCASFSFAPSQTPPVMEFLAGRYWYYYGSSIGGSYSNERRLTLCNDGRFFEGGEVFSSGGAGLAMGQSGNGGQWTVQGDEVQGTIFLTYDNGESAHQDYRVSTDPRDMSGYGPALFFGRSKWLRTGNGACQ
jgi:hypothetical protein